MSSLVTGTDFVSIISSDLDGARAFYRDTLGLPESVVYARDGRVDGCEVETGNLTLQLLSAANLGLDPRPGGVIALRVEDVDAARAELEGKGVAFVQQIDSGVCHQAFFADPDGTTLVLHQRYAS